MGVKSTFRAAGALAKVHVKALPEEFKVAKTMAAADEKVNNIDRSVEKAEAKVIKAADRCESLQEELSAAEKDLDTAKLELAELREIQSAQILAEAAQNQITDPVI